MCVTTGNLSILLAVQAKGADVMLYLCWLRSTILSERIQMDTIGKDKLDGGRENHDSSVAVKGVVH